MALPVEIPAPFGIAPTVVFLSLFPSKRREEVAGFRYSAINRNEANKRFFQKKKTKLPFLGRNII